ncbi:MAG: isoprenylcysteine carboxylmethyltransferase family protein [Thermodesulfobacteriota bacterium]
MNLFWIIIAILAIQRLIELLIARRNERIVKSNGAREYDQKGYKLIVLMHIAFFISLISEYVFFGKTLNHYWIPLVILFLLAQALRYWAITSLGYYWNTKILVTPNTSPISRGPYKYIRHPNYLAVIVEIAVIPLIFSCYLTSIIFTILNLIVLRRRIQIEEQALSTLDSN